MKREVWETRQTMYIEARSRNHFCSGKARNITYSECMSVALVIQHAKRVRRITSLRSFGAERNDVNH